MKEKDTLGTALVHENCPICGKKINEQIIMNSRLIEKYAEEIKSLHNKSIGYAEEPCEECIELKEKGFIFIGIDESKTEDENKPYRTGNMWVVKKEAVEKMITNKNILDIGVSFIDIKIAKQIGLNTKEENE